MPSDRRLKDPDIRALARPPLPVQILAIIGYTGFAIPVSIIAMAQFGFLGLVLAAFLAWQWTRLAGLGGDDRVAQAIDRLRPQAGEPADPSQPRSSGNASFDAYRNTLLERLEKEQENFEGFLSRLRDAKDKSEFDTFLVEREKALDTSRA